MRIIHLLLWLLLLTGLSACDQAYVEETQQNKNDKVYVSFRIEEAERHTTRAVPNAPNGTESTADYESSYKTVDVLFFESNGRKAVVAGKSVFHFDTEGFSPAEEDKENWVDGVYERPFQGNHYRGVYLLDVPRTAVEGKTCVVLLNLPDAVRNRLERGARNEITTLNDLKGLVIKQLTSADEQLGPIPYPLGADNQPDYNSPDFHHVVMIGIKDNVQFDRNSLPAVVNVDMERTIAKVRIVISFTDFRMTLIPAGAPVVFRYKYFPKNTYLGKHSVPMGSPANKRLPMGEIVHGAPVNTTLKVQSNMRYVTQQFYINEYGELQDNVDKHQQPSMSMIMTLPAGFQEAIRKRFFQLMLPRGLERNKFYTIYYTATGMGNDDPSAFVHTYLKVDKIEVAPWYESVENFSLPESYPLKNFIGSPSNSNDQI